MKITKKRLKEIILEELTLKNLNEGCGPDIVVPSPMETVAALKAAGATEQDVLDWVQLLLSEFSASSEEVVELEPVQVDNVPPMHEG